MKHLFYLSLAAFAATVIIACSGKEEVVYDRDASLSKSVAANISAIKSMNRVQWLALSEDYKMPVYRAFTPEQRRVLWLGKLSEVKLLPWTANELAHINKLGEWISVHPNLWTNCNPTLEKQSEVDRFCASWTKEGVERLG